MKERKKAAGRKILDLLEEFAEHRFSKQAASHLVAHLERAWRRSWELEDAEEDPLRKASAKVPSSERLPLSLRDIMVEGPEIENPKYDGLDPEKNPRYIRPKKKMIDQFPSQWKKFFQTLQALYTLLIL